MLVLCRYGAFLYAIVHVENYFALQVGALLGRLLAAGGLRVQHGG